MLLEMAVGDAYGAGFEYADENLPQNDLTHYVKHPVHTSILPGSYTDDTQMAIGVAEAMLSGKPWIKLLLADHFVAAFRRDPRKGYAHHFQEFLESVKTGEEFLSKIKADSDKSGGAMRAGPCGLYPSADVVMGRAIIQASVTHDTDGGKLAACASALLTHYCAYNLGPLSGVGEYLNSKTDEDARWDVDWKGRVGAKGVDSVRAAVTVVKHGRSLAGILKAAVAFGGDVDTVAAIALCAASTSKRIIQDLPDCLTRGLESGPWGSGYLRSLDLSLSRLILGASQP